MLNLINMGIGEAKVGLHAKVLKSRETSACCSRKSIISGAGRALLAKNRGTNLEALEGGPRVS